MSSDSAEAKDRAELVIDRIHSSLPLYTFDWDEIWPQSFRSEDSFGCRSRIAFGDWHFIPADPDAGNEAWERYGNYGVFHCAAIISTADERSELDEAKSQHGFFVRIGKASLGSRDWELWAIQKGTIPGSEYILLAREAGLKELVDDFRVLQRRCPPGRIREAKGLDVWRTRYCAIGSRSELLTLARRMLRRPPVGTISRVGESEEGADDAEGEDEPAAEAER